MVEKPTELEVVLDVTSKHRNDFAVLRHGSEGSGGREELAPTFVPLTTHDQRRPRTQAVRPQCMSSCDLGQCWRCPLMRHTVTLTQRRR